MTLEYRLEADNKNFLLSRDVMAKDKRLDPPSEFLWVAHPHAKGQNLLEK